MGPIVLRVPGNAVGKARPRFNRATGRTYTPSKTVTAERSIEGAWLDAGAPRLPDDTAIDLEVIITVCRPPAHHKRDGQLSAEGLRHPVPRTQKPDLDNAIKLIMDALDGRAYRNDVRITRIVAWRQWGDWPETIISLTPLHAVIGASAGMEVHPQQTTIEQELASAS